jgi:hypothetical protein
MKVAVFSESPTDEAAIRILVDGILNAQTQSIGFPIGPRGWPSVRNNHPAVLRYLHSHTDAEALVVVVDLDTSMAHQAAHDLPGGLDLECRLCYLRESIGRIQRRLHPRAGRGPVKTAIGVAMPAIEAWYLCGSDPRATEAACLQGGSAKRGRDFKNELKRLVYGTDRPSLEMGTQRAVEEAQRLVQDLALLESCFQIGFGSLARDVRNW